MNNAIQFDEYRGRNARDVAAFNPQLDYNGQPLLSQPMDYQRTKSTTGHTFAEDRGELNCLFDGLVQEGSIPAVIWKLNPDDYVRRLRRGVAVPDFRVRLVSGEELFAEITTAGEPDIIRSENTIWDMSRALAQWLMSTPEVRARLRGLALAFIPQNPIKAKDERPALREMKDFALTERLEPYRRYGGRVLSEKYPLLTDLRVLALVQDSSYSNVEIQTPAGAFDPIAQYSSVLNIIQDKALKQYEDFRPIRLVVALQHVIGVTEDVFQYVQRTLQALGRLSGFISRTQMRRWSPTLNPGRQSRRRPFRAS